MTLEKYIPVIRTLSLATSILLLLYTFIKDYLNRTSFSIEYETKFPGEEIILRTSSGGILGSFIRENLELEITITNIGRAKNAITFPRIYLKNGHKLASLSYKIFPAPDDSYYKDRKYVNFGSLDIGAKQSIVFDIELDHRDKNVYELQHITSEDYNDIKNGNFVFYFYDGEGKLHYSHDSIQRYSKTGRFHLK